MCPFLVFAVSHGSDLWVGRGLGQSFCPLPFLWADLSTLGQVESTGSVRNWPDGAGLGWAGLFLKAFGDMEQF